MGNLRYGARWVLDTAESVVAAGTFINITAVEFVGTGDESECILHDGNGKKIWSGKLGDVTVSGYNVGRDFGKDGIVVDGLDLDTIGNGVLYVYLGRRAR